MRIRTLLICSNIGLAAIAVQAVLAQNDWPSYGRDPGAQRYSPLTQINTSNVSTLVQAWKFETRQTACSGEDYLDVVGGYSESPDTSSKEPHRFDPNAPSTHLLWPITQHRDQNVVADSSECCPSLSPLRRNSIAVVCLWLRCAIPVRSPPNCLCCYTRREFGRG